MKKVLILGAGLSGIGSAELAKRNSLDILLSESNEIDAKIKSKLKKLDIEFEENSHTNAKTYSPDLVIKSPGIPDDSEIINSLSKKGFSIISEIEFASLFLQHQQSELQEVMEKQQLQPLFTSYLVMQILTAQFLEI